MPASLDTATSRDSGDPPESPATRIPAVKKGATTRPDERLPFSVLQDAIFLLQKGRICYANPPGIVLAGAADITQLAGREIDDLLVPSMPADESTDGNARYALQRIDGTSLEVTMHRIPYSAAPGIDSMAVLSRTLPEGKLAGEQTFQTLVEHCPDGIVRLDLNLRCLYANPAMAKITGKAAREMAGRGLAEIGMPPDVMAAWEAALLSSVRTKTGQAIEFTLSGNENAGHYAACLIPETGDEGEVLSILGIVHDITGHRKMELEHEQLLARERTARIKAETAARARDEFLAIVSHELRAPLNGIQSWAHILETYVKESLSAPLAQRALNGIRTGVAQQVRLIEDLLDATRMMSGKLRLVKQPFILLPVIQAAVESVRGAAASKHISISCNYQIASEQVDGDSDRVQQIIWNLLSNAIKFTPNEGTVWLTAMRSGAWIVITVRDNGVGISPEFLPHLFNRFSQEDTSSTRAHSGLGLGLFLVRHLVELHGGLVHAESAGEGKGTTFSIELPLRSSQERYLSPPQAEGSESIGTLPSLNGLRILLVDDQEETRESLSMVLLSAGANVFSAASSREVLEWLPTVGLDELPDILICDIAMPFEDGYSVLRKLRTWKTDKGFAPLHQLPALALTAFAQREDRIRALTAGFQMHMTKPVAPEELIVVVAMMASRG